MYESYPPDPPELTYTNGAKESNLNNGSKPACCLTGRHEGIRPSPEEKFGILQGPLPLISSLPKTYIISLSRSLISTYSLNPTLLTKFCKNGATLLATNSHPAPAAVTVQHETPVPTAGQSPVAEPP